MESLIFQWLNNNNETGNLIENILILSINGLYISYEELKNYCTKISNSINGDTLIKKKRKTLDTTTKTTTAISSFSNNEEINKFGLNLNQFSIINDKIQLLHNIYKDNPNSNYQISNHKQTNTNSSKIIKFDSSIILIIENNKNNKQHIQPKITDNDYLFYKIWHNLCIRNIILYQVRLYNIHNNHVFIGDLLMFSSYKFNDYLSNIKFNQDVTLNSFSNLFPSSLTSIHFPDKYPKLEPNCLPKTLKFINFGNLMNQKLESTIIPASLTSIIFGNSWNQSLDGSWIPDGIKHLQFGDKFAQSFLPNQLPNSLTSLILSNQYDAWILPNSIPESVTTLKYIVNTGIKKYKSNQSVSFISATDGNGGTIEFNDDLDEIHNIIDLKQRIPKHTTSLVFDSNFNQPIKVGDIPHNVSHIEFGQLFDSIIAPKALPISIRSIKFGLSYDCELGINSLPPNLTSITFGKRFNHPLTSAHLPSSITKITFGTKFNQEINNGLFLNTNLRELDLGGFNSNIHPNTFPDSLTSLEARYFNRQLLPNSLPSSLKSLTFSEFNKTVNQSCLPEGLESLSFYSFFSTFSQLLLPNTLPNSLTSLKLGDYNQPFQPGVLLNNLKILQLGSSFNQDLTSPNCLPPSLTSIDIGTSTPKFSIDTIPKSLQSIHYTNDDNNTMNIHYLNSLDIDIFHRYFKFYKT